ncbi:contractile injection system tape measure protein [Chitinophaga sp. Cy-1792]|uniref:contractile injection system tape measure protein n=1 Tax=Chitinophaga sp. Cy-1792 TaxID=2608339 RepID=UPI00141E14A8|nr:contractile injection system tape measure protein [Chitinophaga sp. Cy-1792]NIG53820.1 hypothetical protein [Chitinophaga sp. Cy-1792]
MAEHLIQQLVVSIQMKGDEMQAIALQQEMTALCEGPLLQMLEQLFDQYDNGQQVIIDKLEIKIPEDDMQLLPPAILTTVSKEISHVLQQKTSIDEFTAIPKPSIDPLSENKKNNTTDYTPQQLTSILCTFLQTGQLPWWAGNTAFDQLTTAIPTALKLAKTLQQEVIAVLKQSAAAQYRLLHQFTATWQMSFLYALQPTLFTAIESTVATLNAIIARKISNSIISSTDVMQALKPWILQHIITHTEGRPEEVRLLAGIISQFEKMNIMSDIPALINELPPAQQQAVTDQLQPQNISIASSSPENWQTNTEQATAGYFIHNAGLVLLAPFLGTFLRACDVADEKQVTNESYAVALLELLATGRTGVGEHELVFNKVLCGIPVDRPLERINSIQPEHTNEAAQLLQTVIGYWKSLKSTSIDGLRVSFLQRTGKLSLKENNEQWRLQVTPESYDQFLLPDLPWNYQMVPLLFSKQQFIWVEWS